MIFIDMAQIPWNRIPIDELIRECPVCHDKITYKNRTSFLLARRKNGECKKCSCERVKVHLVQRGEKRTKESLEKFAEAVRNGCLKKRPPHSIKTKAKIRQTKLKHYVENGKLYHGCTNPKACEYIDSINAENRWNLRHAKNGGEVIVCGYHLDGYDEKRNIVLEYDEPHHYSGGILRKKDVVRQGRIMALLDCEFWRYDEKRNNLYKVLVEELNTSGHVGIV